MAEEVFWREMLSEADGDDRTVRSMLEVAESTDPGAEMEAAAERLLIRAAQAGNVMTAEQVSRFRLAARNRAAAGGPVPWWRGEVAAAPSMLTRAA